MLDIILKKIAIAATSPKLTGTQIVTGVLNTFYFVTGAVAVIMIIYSGIQYMLSGGDTTRAKSARLSLTMAIIGLVIIFSAYAITNFVLKVGE